MLDPRTAGPAQGTDPLEGTDLPARSPEPTAPASPPSSGTAHPKRRDRGAPPRSPRTKTPDRQRGPSLASQDKASIILGEAEFGRRKSGMNRPHRDWGSKREKIPVPPTIAPGTLRVVPLGGCEELGKSLVAIETAEDLIIVDAGLQWPDETMHGVDFVIPDVTYVSERTSKLRAILLTGPHDDRSGGLPTILRLLATPKVPILALPLTAEVARIRLAGAKVTADVRDAAVGTEIPLGHMAVEFIAMNSNAPDSAAVSIRTPLGTVFISGSYKIDHEPIDQPTTDLAALRRIGDRGVQVALIDATSASHDGYSLSERKIGAQLEPLISGAKGRILLGLSDTLVTRLVQIVSVAAAHGRKVWVEAERMRSILDAAIRLKRVVIPAGTLVDAQAAAKLSARELVVVTSGAQSERFATLGKIARGEHPTISIQAGDTVAFSPSLVGGSLRSIEHLMNAIYAKQAQTVSLRILDPHSTGHAKAEETKLMLQLIRPKVVVHQNGNHALGALALQVARQMGYEIGSTALLLLNGAVLEVTANGATKVRREMATARLTIVDGHGVGDVGETVLRDREKMAEGGVVLIIVAMDKHGELHGEPTIVTRGFVHIAGADELLTQLRAFVRKVCTTYKELASLDQKEFKFMLQREVEKFLFQKTEREPIVVPLLTLP